MDEPIETTETPEETAEQPDTGKGLRAQLEKANAELKGYRTAERADAFRDNGLDPEKGQGKAFARGYDGENTAEAVAKYLQDEYEYVFEAPEGEHPQAEAIAQGHAALDQIGQTAGSVPVSPTEGDVLAKAESDGDYKTTMAIKSQQMAEMMRRNR